MSDEFSVFRFPFSVYIIPPPLRSSPELRGTKWMDARNQKHETRNHTPPQEHQVLTSGKEGKGILKAMKNRHNNNKC